MIKFGALPHSIINYFGYKNSIINAIVYKSYYHKDTLLFIDNNFSTQSVVGKLIEKILVS